MPSKAQHQTIGLYVHWPYCAKICPYCDFNIYKNKPSQQEALFKAILADITYWRKISGPRQLISIHFGGGTPSLISSDNVQRIISLASSLWTPVKNLEVGLEANPNDITVQSLSGWRGAGVNRLSIGVQSFDDGALKFLGRDHGGQQSRMALEQAIDIMPRVSADLIYGWARQTPEKWQADLEAATSMGAEHISAYQLTIEKRTAFAKAQARGNEKAVDNDQSADLYEQGQRYLTSAGFDQYEVSNFAKAAHAKSSHNLLYWQGEDYIGVGPGAHGRLTIDGNRRASICTAKPQTYIDHVKKNGHGIDAQEILTPQEWSQEYVLMGLRITKGISLARFKTISGKSLNPKRIRDYIQAGLLQKQQGRLMATPAGRLVLDRLCHELLQE